MDESSAFWSKRSKEGKNRKTAEIIRVHQTMREFHPFAIEWSFFVVLCDVCCKKRGEEGKIVHYFR